MSTTTSFTLSPASFTLGGGTGDFSGLTVTQSDSAFDLASISSFDFSSATVGSFTASSLLAAPSFNAATHTLSFVVLGTFAPGSDFTGPASLTADEAFSLNQVGGANTGIGITATFFSPQVIPTPPSSPEPMTISLFGAGLAALGVMRRRRK
ncbi:MAG TPA: PEP-CTERM sorting domain-containing protein [Alphaproteobacteria bacterium]|nr:PEP-CTERM sorting domain-containing protein [Alphaproteobacteria bacterium]